MGSPDQTPARITATLAIIIMPSSLFSETSAERFRRESQEMWDKVQSEGTSKNDSTDQVVNQSDQDIKKIPVETKREVPIAVAAAPRSRPPPPDLFPRKLKTKLIRPKPALWETSKEETKNLKNTLLKKDADINVIRKTKASA